MGTYPVKFEHEERWAVYQSTSESMYSPTFGAWLPAFLFAEHYGSAQSRAELFLLDFSDAAQEALHADIEAWFEATFPHDPRYSAHTDMRVLPQSWLDELEPLPAADEIDLADCPYKKSGTCNHLDAKLCCGGGADKPCGCDSCHPSHLYDYDQLISDLEVGTGQAVELVVSKFREWQAVRA
ncbi:MAG: hypothetical protein WBQ94_04220 [Terracidiphilus sp.]